MSVYEVDSKDHPPGFMHIEVLVSFWDGENSPSYLTFFLEKREDMNSVKIRTLAINKARQFLSKIDYLH